MYCSRLGLSLLVVAGSRSHLLEISTHMNSTDVRKKQGGEGGGPPSKFYISSLLKMWLELLHGVVFSVLAKRCSRAGLSYEVSWWWLSFRRSPLTFVTLKFYSTVMYEMT